MVGALQALILRHCMTLKCLIPINDYLLNVFSWEGWKVLTYFLSSLYISHRSTVFKKKSSKLKQSWIIATTRSCAFDTKKLCKQMSSRGNQMYWLWGTIIHQNIKYICRFACERSTQSKCFPQIGPPHLGFPTLKVTPWPVQHNCQLCLSPCTVFYPR